MIENDASESAAAPMNDGVPSSLGYRMPAEWEPHEATWIAWPHNRDDWPGKFAPIPWVYTEIVRHLSRVERVHIVVRRRAMKRRVADQLDAVGVDLEAVRFFRGGHRPRLAARLGAHVRRQGRAGSGAAEDRVGLIDWRFNAWAKYDNHRRDNRLPRKIARWLGLRDAGCRGWSRGAGVARRDGGGRNRRQRPGNAADDRGMPARARSRRAIPASTARPSNGFSPTTSASHTSSGWAGESTVTTPTAMSTTWRALSAPGPWSRSSSPTPTTRTTSRCRTTSGASSGMRPGRPAAARRRAAHAPAGRLRGQRLPASYANFYIANGLVLVPTFNDPADRRALDSLARLFPDREVVGIHSVDLVLGLGTLHCLSQQQPAGSTS